MKDEERKLIEALMQKQEEERQFNERLESMQKEERKVLDYIERKQKAWYKRMSKGLMIEPDEDIKPQISTIRRGGDTR